MIATNMASAIGDALAGRRLLEHPFYRRWEAGQVSMEELAAYAAQYRHFERYLPSFLSRLVDQLPEGAARRLVMANLADELGDPIAHVELFERFATAVGADGAQPSTAMSDLLDTYEGLLSEGALPGLAGLVGYEAQASDVARRKADGLRAHHGLGDNAVSFWEHHAAVDARHRDWTVDALAENASTPDDAVPFAHRSADAWWAFLDEREALVTAR